MQLSLFTPTHQPNYLTELHESLLKQKGDVPWEWVIAANGACAVGDIPASVSEDPHVKVVSCDLTGIGALKKFACEQCTGDVLVEVDHDDTLAADCFVELAEAYTNHPDGFYYSDFINVFENGRCETFSPYYGWQSYRVNVDGTNYTACRAFPPSARALYQIYYAPNHVRAWSRSAYIKTGGHDPALAVGDDHDLVCRTYLTGAPFVWIPKPLYIYRRTTTQSYVVHNKAIQVQQQLTGDKYLHDLVETECKQNHWPLVNLGTDHRADYQNIDLKKGGTKLPTFEPNSIGCFRIADGLQYVPRQHIVMLMNMLYDAVRPNGWLLTATPATDDGKGRPGRGSFQDPDHCSYWNVNNFWYLTQRKYAAMLKGYKGRFQAVRLFTHYPSEWHNENAIPYVVGDLCSVKGQHQPGACLI